MTVKRIGRQLLILVVILALISGAGLWAFPNLGRWLVAPDRLQHARAIPVLSRSVLFRTVEAADLYHQGWAPEVWLWRDEIDDVDETFIELGVPPISDQDYNKIVLERLAIPKEAIRILEPPPATTVGEITLIADEMRRRGGDKVILITSAVHTRRTRVMWHIVARSSPSHSAL